MKLLVETTGAFMLVDPVTREEIAAHRPSVVSNSAGTQNFAAQRKIRILQDLPKEATDTDFAIMWRKDGKKAISAFRRKHSKKPDELPESEETE